MVVYVIEYLGLVVFLHVIGHWLPFPIYDHFISNFLYCVFVAYGTRFDVGQYIFGIFFVVDWEYRFLFCYGVFLAEACKMFMNGTIVFRGQFFGLCAEFFFCKTYSTVYGDVDISEFPYAFYCAGYYEVGNMVCYF